MDKTVMMNNTIFLFLFFTLTFLTSCVQQENREVEKSENPVISNTISNQQITSFAEDGFGHIWISTIRGLNKFNVYEFHQYFYTNNEHNISDNRIQHLYTDSQNNLWVATVNGISRYNDQDGFDRIRMESASQNAINLFENNDGKLFLNLNIQICAWNPETDIFEVVIDDLDMNNFVTNCYVDKSNFLWVVTPNEIRKYNSTTCKLIANIKNERYITHTFKDENDRIWLSSWGHKSLFNMRTGEHQTAPYEITKHHLLSGAIITYMHTYNNASILINTQKDGLFYYNHILGTVLHQSESGFPFEVPNFEITTMFTDSRDNLWIGSFDQGYVARYKYKERFNNNNYLQTNLRNQSVISVAPDQNQNLWIVTRSNGVKIFKHEAQQIEDIPQEKLFPKNGSTFLHKIKRVYIDRGNTIWLLSDWMLLECSYKNETFNVNNTYFFPDGLMSVTQDQKGTVWLGGLNEKIYVKRKNENIFQLYPLYGKGFNFTAALLTLSSGKVLVASFGHDLQLIDAETWEVSTIPIKHLIKSSQFIPTVLFEDTEGKIWIGTITNGLFTYSPKTNTIKSIEGAASSDISSICQDILGNMWIGTLYGLSKYDRVTHQFTSYYITDGIGGNQFNEQSSRQLPDFTLVFGGTHGLTFFNPIDVPYNRTVSLLFQNLKVHNRLVRPGQSNNIDKHLTYNPNIKHKYYQNSFSISFAALDYCEFERIHYSYMLEGFDNFWIDAHNSREAYYSNLPSGKYIFRVRTTLIKIKR